jgi:hypothetical protein
VRWSAKHKKDDPFAIGAMYSFAPDCHPEQVCAADASKFLQVKSLIWPLQKSRVGTTREVWPSMARPIHGVTRIDGIETVLSIQKGSTDSGYTPRLLTPLGFVPLSSASTAQSFDSPFGFAQGDNREQN